MFCGTTLPRDVNCLVPWDLPIRPSTLLLRLTSLYLETRGVLQDTYLDVRQCYTQATFVGATSLRHAVNARVCSTRDEDRRRALLSADRWGGSKEDERTRDDTPERRPVRPKAIKSPVYARRSRSGMRGKEQECG